MNTFISRIRRPVKREAADQYVRVTLLSFAASVILTRLFLEFTGYPQLGTSTLHIAHVLWGGLLLFVASLLPLVLANRWVYTTGAVLSGIGVGLFIDEVGKFITQNNDYFYPPAAPIIYAFFLLVVLLYFQVRRPYSTDARAELYRSLDALAEVLDHDMDAKERSRLAGRLQNIIQQSTDPELTHLARSLLEFLNSEAFSLAPETISFPEQWWEQIQSLLTRYIDRRWLKAGLIVGFGLVSLQALAATVGQAVLFASEDMGAFGVFWPWSRFALEGGASLLLLTATGLLLAGRDRRGVTIAHFALMLSLTVVNVLVFYFDQFQALADTFLQFGLLLGTIYYRQHFL